ncbi:MAG: hypothetical protein V7701_02025 [Sneathiella sp.]
MASFYAVCLTIIEHFRQEAVCEFLHGGKGTASVAASLARTTSNRHGIFRNNEAEQLAFMRAQGTKQ